MSAEDEAPVPLLKSFTEFLEAPDEIPCVVPGKIPRGALVAIVGPSGSAKSFVATQLTVSVAAARPFLGGDVGAGNSLYVAAEGAPGLPKRFRAQVQYLELDPALIDSGLAILPTAIEFTSPSFVERVIAEARRRFSRLDLIVIDTWAATLPSGTDENSASDTESMMKWLRYLVKVTGATVLIVHHKGHNSERERGSSAFRAALDGLFFVKKEGNVVTMTCEKSRDLVPFDPIRWTLTPFGSSAVLVPLGVPESSQAVQPSARMLLSRLVEGRLGIAMRAKDWQAAALPLSKSQFYELKARLLQEGYVAQMRDGFIPTRKAERLLDLSGESDRTPANIRSDSGPSGVPLGTHRTGHSGRSDRTPTGLRSDNRGGLGPGLEPAQWEHFSEPAA